MHYQLEDGRIIIIFVSGDELTIRCWLALWDPATTPESVATLLMQNKRAWAAIKDSE